MSVESAIPHFLEFLDSALDYVPEEYDESDPDYSKIFEFSDLKLRIKIGHFVLQDGTQIVEVVAVAGDILNQSAFCTLLIQTFGAPLEVWVDLRMSPDLSQLSMLVPHGVWDPRGTKDSNLIRIRGAKDNRHFKIVNNLANLLGRPVSRRWRPYQHMRWLESQILAKLP